ncbi:hypothetical protein HaLaN_16925 [Haematococcus lacustris]|uniref:Uncharacterized protein n=1 Tax=Haematococcus lacustris TaxID=44745 RepID=A0A699ZLT5_HAELA|nr:hypothetical protein HaLaN_16925 [Haematococcus lacustris]
MLRVLAPTAAAGAHSYTTLALLLDDAPELERAPELEQTLSTTITRVLHQPPSAQQLAPLALDLVWGMEGMLQPGGGLVHQAAG